MLSIRKDSAVCSGRISSPSSNAWLYLIIEFIIGLGISGFLTFLNTFKSILPKPPRDLTGDVVLVTGAASTLGSLLVEEFARGGCSVICVDKDLRSLEGVAAKLRSKYPDVESIGSYQRKEVVESQARRPLTLAYECDLWNQDDIRNVANQVRKEVGGVDVLVTCAGDPGQEIFDTVTRTLMSHYWTVLAFIPSLLYRKRAHVIGVTPTVSTDDAYMGSKAAVAGLMASMGQEFSGSNNRLTFMTVAPKAEPSLLNQSEREVAQEVVLAVRRDQNFVSLSWRSKLLYRTSCLIYVLISSLTRFIDAFEK